ncbi:MAG: DUF6122 family protein [Candidatus Woesearchaeota archaeon]|nr:DUF6122 family protein [Candidatus Woesearchaeota archaeon]
MPNLVAHLIADVVLLAVIYRVKKPANFHWVAWQVFGSNILDIDHFLADPFYDPSRCSLVHPLHSWAVPIYVVFSFYGRFKYFFWAALLHVILDALDCLM